MLNLDNAHPISTGVRLDVEAVTKKFGSRIAVDSCSFQAEPGEFVVIVGKSGCGKTTLLRLIAGLEASSSGTIAQDGTPVHGLNAFSRVMFQDSRLLPWKSVLDNVQLGLRARTKEEGKRLLRQVGLEGRESDWPNVLSGGQRQRVALARALAGRPKLLLLDEPLGALDALTRYEMQGLIESLWLAQGFTAVLVTHDPEEAVMLGDRVIVLNEGRVEREIRIDLPRPRDRDSLELIAYRHTLLQTLLGRPHIELSQATSRPPLGDDFSLDSGSRAHHLG